jgi:hypothetical protein
MNNQQVTGAYWGNRITTLITLATPHHGTPLTNGLAIHQALGNALRGYEPLGFIYDETREAVDFVHYNRSDLRSGQL